MPTLLRRFTYLLRWRQSQADLAEELTFHREMKEQELKDRLATDHATATAAARRELGSMALAIDRARDVWVPTWLQGFGQDVRLAVRSFRGAPIVTIVSLTT